MSQLYFVNRDRAAVNVRFLKGVGAEHAGGHLSGYGDKRNGVHVGIGQAGDEVCRTGSGSGDYGGHLSGHPGVAVRHMDGPLFVTGEEMREFRLKQVIIKGHDGPARDPEGDFHPVGF